MIFSKDNEGREIKIKGGADVISYVLASGEKFRVKSEENAAIVHDYGLGDLDVAILKVSFNRGETWEEIAVKKQRIL